MSIIIKDQKLNISKIFSDIALLGKNHTKIEHTKIKTNVSLDWINHTRGSE